jgi:hypothetical protein
LLDFLLVCDVERSIEIEKPARRANSHLQARRTND